MAPKHKAPGLNAPERETPKCETVSLIPSDYMPFRLLRQIRFEANLMYYKLNSFHTLLKADEFESDGLMKYWLNIALSEELGSVKSFTCELMFDGGDALFDLNHRYVRAIVGLLRDLRLPMDDGLAQSALHVIYSVTRTEQQIGRNPTGCLTSIALSTMADRSQSSSI